MMKKAAYSILAAVLLSSCTDSVERQLQPIKVNVERMEITTSIPTHTYIGTLESAGTISMAFQTSGRVVSVPVHAGQWVKEGQVLAQLNDTQAKNALQAARATLSQAEDGFRRTQALYEKGGVTEIKYMEVKTQLEQAQSVVALAEETLRQCTLRAPQDGVIGSLNLLPGEVVLPAVPIMTLLSNSGLNVAFTVSENQIAGIRLGDKGRVNVTALGDGWVSGKVVEKNLVAGKVAHSYTVKIKMDDIRPYENMMPGMIAKVQLDGEVIEGFLLPAKCIQTGPSGQMVWAVRDSAAYRRPVTIGQFVQDGVLATGGLERGDCVVTDGFQKLYEGARVTIENRK